MKRIPKFGTVEWQNMFDKKNEYSLIGINGEWFIYDKKLHCTAINTQPFKTYPKAVKGLAEYKRKLKKVV